MTTAVNLRRYIQECIKELLRTDQQWIPAKKGYSMYLRPVCFSTTPWWGLINIARHVIHCSSNPPILHRMPSHEVAINICQALYCRPHHPTPLTPSFLG
jgi:hypothetical protein